MKKILSFVIILSLVFLSGCTTKLEGILYLGTPLESSTYSVSRLIEENDKINVDMSFSQKKMTSSNLYRLIEQDAMNLATETHILQAIEHSAVIILNVGAYDIINAIRVSGGEIIYEENVVEGQMELVCYYLYHILDEIREINEQCKIIFILPYNPLVLDGEGKRTMKSLLSAAINILDSLQEDFKLNVINLNNYENYLLSSHRLSDDGVKYCYQEIRSFLNG